MVVKVRLGVVVSGHQDCYLTEDAAWKKSRWCCTQPWVRRYYSPWYGREVYLAGGEVSLRPDGTRQVSLFGKGGKLVTVVEVD